MKGTVKWFNTQKGYVLIDMRPDMKSGSRKNVFFFKDTPQLRKSMSDYINR